jgi:hypothetical protein
MWRQKRFADRPLLLTVTGNSGSDTWNDGKVRAFDISNPESPKQAPRA